jgi:hypothetical protein
MLHGVTFSRAGDGSGGIRASAAASRFQYNAGLGEKRRFREVLGRVSSFVGVGYESATLVACIGDRRLRAKINWNGRTPEILLPRARAHRKDVPRPVLLAAVLAYALPNSSIGLVVTFATWIAGLIVAIRLARTGVRKLIWRLRNRLIVAYAFIAMVPIALILALVLVSAYGLTGQIAISTPVRRAGGSSLRQVEPPKPANGERVKTLNRTRLQPRARLIVAVKKSVL